VSYSDRPLPVCLSVNFYIFDFFPRTTGPIFTRLGTNHPWGKGILNSSNEGDWPFSRGDDHKRVNITDIFLKIFSRTSRPFSINLGKNCPWVKGILNCSNRRSGPLQWGDNRKNGVRSFKSFLMNHKSRKADLHKSFRI
jgi:hypothetical protein